MPAIEFPLENTKRGIILFLLLGTCTLTANFFFLENRLDLILLGGFCTFLPVIAILNKPNNKYIMNDSEIVYKDFFVETRIQINDIKRAINKHWGGKEILLELNNNDYQLVGGLGETNKRRFIEELKKRNQHITVLSEATEYAATPDFRG